MKRAGLALTLIALASSPCAEANVPTLGSWSALSNEIKSASVFSPPLEIALAANFDCDYKGYIEIPSGLFVTIFGNGAVLDPSGPGSLFDVAQNAKLTLYSVSVEHATGARSDQDLKVSGQLCCRTLKFFAF
jgi:hypothetical protein